MQMCFFKQEIYLYPKDVLRFTEVFSFKPSRVHADVMQMFGLGFRELKKPEWYGKKPK